MFEKLKIASEINTILRACDFHAGMKQSSIEKDINGFIPYHAARMRRDRLITRQATVDLIVTVTSAFDLEKLQALTDRVPLNFYGLCCLWRYAKLLREKEPQLYEPFYREPSEGVATKLTDGFTTLMAIKPNTSLRV